MDNLIRAIALDIDGTITHDNRQLDLRAVEPIRKAEELGIPVCLATGNVLCFAETTATLLGSSGPMIVEDGGIVFVQETRREYQLGSVEEVDRGIEVLKEAFGNIEHTKSSEGRSSERTLERTVSAEDIRKVFEENKLNLEVVDSKYALHIKEAGVNKGKGLEKVSSLLDCSVSEIAAMGDSNNDVAMLDKAGISFAPANAGRKAKEACSHVTEGSHGAGVKEAIEKILEDRGFEPD